MPRTYKSVHAMLKANCEDKSFTELFKRNSEEHSVGRSLFALRCKLGKVKGFTKKEMERIEGSRNSELSMKEVGQYLDGLLKAK